MFVQQQIEASKPPPRLIEVSAADLELTPSPPPRPSPTPATPAASAPAISKEVTSAVTARPTFTPVTTSKTEGSSAPEAATLIPEPTATTTPAAVSPESVPESKLVEETVLSLADNPLLVVEDEANPGSALTEPGNAPPAENSDPDRYTGLPLTRIVADSIGLDSEVVEVGWQQVVQNGATANVWVVADYAAGWHKNSALPGQGGNIVFSAHHNIKGEVFRYTVDLEPGDIVTLYDEKQS